PGRRKLREPRESSGNLSVTKNITQRRTREGTEKHRDNCGGTGDKTPGRRKIREPRESSGNLRVTKNNYTEKKTEKARRTTERVMVGQETNHQERENSVNLRVSSVFSV